MPFSAAKLPTGTLEVLRNNLTKLISQAAEALKQG
jgi:hypothetical protein